MIERHFLVIALFLSTCALIYPPAFIWAKTSIPYLLGVIMFGMGLTLETSDFVIVLKRWKIVLLGIAAQYSIMPLLSLSLSYLLNLPYDIFIGMVILGACPGGKLRPGRISCRALFLFTKRSAQRTFQFVA